MDSQNDNSTAANNNSVFKRPLPPEQSSRALSANSQTKRRRLIKPPSRLYHSSQVAAIIANSSRNKLRRIRRQKQQKPKLLPPALIKQEPASMRFDEHENNDDENSTATPLLIFDRELTDVPPSLFPPPPAIRTFRALEGMRAQDIVQRMADRGHIVWVNGELKWVGSQGKEDSNDENGKSEENQDEDYEDEGIDCKEDSDDEKKIRAAMDSVTLKSKKTNFYVATARRHKGLKSSHVQKSIHETKIKKMVKAMGRQVRKAKKVLAFMLIRLALDFNLVELDLDHATLH